MHVRAFCNESMEDAARAVTRMSVMMCQPFPRGINKSKNARKAHFSPASYASGSLAYAIIAITPKNIMSKKTRKDPSKNPFRMAGIDSAAQTRCQLAWLNISAEAICQRAAGGIKKSIDHEKKSTEVS